MSPKKKTLIAISQIDDPLASAADLTRAITIMSASSIEITGDALNAVASALNEAIDEARRRMQAAFDLADTLEAA